MPVAHSAHWRNADLLIVGHGASRVPEAGFAICAHAAKVEMQGIFASVRAGLLVGTPQLETAFTACRSDTVFVVPFFMSDGHAVREQVPGRLGPDPRIRLTAPAGTHPRTAEIVTLKAAALCRAQGFDPAAAELCLVGHGSTKDPASRTATDACAARISGFATVTTAFLDVEPLLAAKTCNTASSVTVFAGYFADMGSHAAKDIPDLLGLKIGAQIAVRSDGHTLLYTGAIGPEPAMTEIILDRVAEANDAGQR